MTEDLKNADQVTNPSSATFMDLIREVGDKATEQVRQEIERTKSPRALSQQPKSETLSHESQREMAAQSVLQNGKAATIEEARQMVDEAI